MGRDKPTASKPPNILVHHGDGGQQGWLRRLVVSVAGRSCFSVYDLREETPAVWMDHTSLLVLSGELSDTLSARARQFLDKGGAVLSLSSSFQVEGESSDVKITHPVVTEPGKSTSADGSADTPRVTLSSCASAGGKVLSSNQAWDMTSSEDVQQLRSLISSQLGVQCGHATEAEVVFQPGHVLSAEPAALQKLRHQSSTGTAPTLELVTSLAGVTATAEYLPLTTSPPPPTQWNVALYEKLLKTRRLGRCLVFLPSVTSSMDVLPGSRLPDGTAVVCDRQTRGRGRAGNSWLSPLGCCMLAVKVEVSLRSPLGRRLCWLQHILSLAVVEAVDDPRLGLKWPNDIYWEGAVKVGGVLVETYVTGQHTTCNLGVGVNLDNAVPTDCLNAHLSPPLAREQLVAETLNQLERLLAADVDELSERYRRRWCHHGQPVTLQRHGRQVEAVVSGLDPSGYLVVTCDEDGAQIAVMPDGNSFDMLKGLTAPKFKPDAE